MGETSNFSKFFLLLWKNWIIQKRHWVQTFFEIFIPVAFSALLILFRSILDPEVIDTPTTYSPLKPNDLFEFENKTRFNFDRNFTDFVAYWPQNSLLEQLVVDARDILLTTRTFDVVTPPDGIPLAQFLATNQSWVGIEFPESYAGLTALPNNLEFKLRFPSELRTTTAIVEFANWFTNRMFPAFAIPGPRNPDWASGGQPPGYYQEGFLPMQYALTRAFTMQKAGLLAQDVPDLLLQRFPYKEYLDDPLLIGLEAFIPLIIILSLLYTAINIVKYVAIEKEKQLKEAMKIMGLSNWLHWSAWFIKCYIFLFITASCMVLIFKVSEILRIL